MGSYGCPVETAVMVKDEINDYIVQERAGRQSTAVFEPPG
jgi:hypothetical protein